MITVGRGLIKKTLNIKIIHVIKCKLTSNFVANCNKIFFIRLGTETCYLKFLIWIVLITVGRVLIKKTL